MGRVTSLGYLPPLGKSSASLGRVGWEALGEQWCGMASHKSHTRAALWGVGYQVWPNWLCLGKGGELKNWMLEQPVSLIVAQAFSSS